MQADLVTDVQLDPQSQSSPSPRKRQQQLHAAARLQLAAALLEYDYEQDGKLAEHSAIFAPYRQEPDYTSPQVNDAAAQYSPGLDNEAEVDHQLHEPPHSVIYSNHGIRSSHANTISPRLDDNPTRKSFDFLSPQSEHGVTTSPDLANAASPPVASLAFQDDTEVNEDELASEWGLDNVVSKFDKLDSDAFRVEASKMKAAAAEAAASSSGNGNKGKNKSKGRKRSGTSGSDILLNLPDTTSFDAGLKLVDNNGEEEEELDPTLGIDSHSAPTVINMNKRKLRHRSGSEVKAVRKSLELELEMAFSATSGEIDNITSSGEYAGNRSRASSLGAFNNEAFKNPEIAKVEAVRAIANYADEEVARPPSSLSIRSPGVNDGYISRFDPKAVAAQREEELSTRPRFPFALHPKILVMPAPLGELEAEGKALKEAAAEQLLVEEGGKEKPRIEREAGKLYGKSLMDELNFRKEKQKSRNRAFKGDSRKAMMDMKQFQRNRSPSPLSIPVNIGQLPSFVKSNEDVDRNEEKDQDEDDDDKPLRPPSANSAPIADDPWIKYTSHRSLANVAKGKPTVEISKLAADGEMKRSPTSPAFLSSEKHKSTSPGLSPALDTKRHTLSTAELQQQYKKNRQSMLGLDSLAKEDEDQVSEDDEDDDIPLGTRQKQLSASQNPKPISPTSPLTPVQADKPGPKGKTPKEVQSVFGVDLVMQKELAKLEKILEIEEAERKIKLERERIKNAEKEAKEAKKRAKAAKKEKKGKEKEKAKQAAVGKEKSKTQRVSRELDQDVNMQWRSDNRVAVANALDVPLQSPPQAWQDDHQQQSYYSLAGHGEVDDFYGGTEHRNSLLPHEAEEEALTPRPGHTRSSSFAPSLTLPFLAGETGPGEGSSKPATLGWFGTDDNQKHNDSDNDEGSDREERVRSKSPFGIENFASDDEERVDATAVWAEDTNQKGNDKTREVTYDPSKKPELQRMSVAASFAGVLEGFGIGELDDENGSDDEEGDKENVSSANGNRRLSIHGEDNSDSEEDERRPLSAILMGNHRKSQAFGKQLAKVTVEPPRLDLPLDFAIAPKQDSDSEDEDEAPLALKRLNTRLATDTTGRTFDTEENEEEVDSEEDDLPLAAKQDDDKPLGQAHPIAALSQQMELQQQQNVALISHMQLQYQYALQMQMQQAILQQADIQGYSASQLNVVPPSAALSGAASDIGADLGPDPRLVNSVDRWRQGVE